MKSFEIQPDRLRIHSNEYTRTSFDTLPHVSYHDNIITFSCSNLFTFTSGWGYGKWFSGQAR